MNRIANDRRKHNVQVTVCLCERILKVESREIENAVYQRNNSSLFFGRLFSSH